MRVQFTKRADGSGAIRCVREDGSSTWQRQTDRHAQFFALHDLTHLAVESVLGYKQGFFGLVAEGWDIEDTTGKGARGHLPDETTEVECLVSLFFSEQASRTRWTAIEFNSGLVTYMEQAGRHGPLRTLTEDEISSVRKRRNELFRMWESVPAGQTLDLAFEATL
jgi:hypothetical protein